MVTETKTEHTQEPQKSWKDNLLKAAGAGYSLGDVTMGIAAGLRGGGKASSIITGSLIWLAGGLAAAIYGNPSPQRRLEISSDKFVRYMESQGVEIPKDLPAQNALLAKPGFAQKCQNFFYQHPSEMLNLAYGIGAIFLLKTGISDIRAGKKNLLPSLNHSPNMKGLLAASNEISNDFWMGALISGGALSGLLIKEDPQAREKAKDGGVFAKAAAFAKEKPLRITGTLYGLNNIFTVMRTLEDYHNKDSHTKYKVKPFWFTGITAASYLASNAILTTVSRDQTTKKMTQEAVAKLEDAAARLISAQPIDKQKELLAAAADYLSKESGITLSAPELAQAMATRVSELTQQRMQEGAEAVGWAERTKARAQQVATADTGVALR